MEFATALEIILILSLAFHALEIYWILDLNDMNEIITEELEDLKNGH